MPAWRLSAPMKQERVSQISKRWGGEATDGHVLARPTVDQASMGWSTERPTANIPKGEAVFYTCVSLLAM